MFLIETSKAEDFIGRTLEMYQIIQSILEKRVVNVMGIPGIGKTTLVKAVAHYLNERHQFKDGIIILSLRNLDQTSMVITRLELIIKKRLKEEGNQTVSDHMVLLDHVVSFLADKEILLIMDNAETPSKKDPKNFSDLIKNVLDNCPLVRFLFTSRYNIG
jgi:predicted ATPase